MDLMILQTSARCRPCVTIVRRTKHPGILIEAIGSIAHKERRSIHTETSRRDRFQDTIAGFSPAFSTVCRKKQSVACQCKEPRAAHSECIDPVVRRLTERSPVISIIGRKKNAGIRPSVEIRPVYGQAVNESPIRPIRLHPLRAQRTRRHHRERGEEDKCEKPFREHEIWY